MPRFSGGNHPTTSRPLAELLLAAAIPPSSRNAPTATSECTDAAANAAPRPGQRRTQREHEPFSPILIDERTQAISVATMPKVGIDESSPAVRDQGRVRYAG